MIYCAQQAELEDRVIGLISVSLPADGTTADVSDYNVPVTTIVTLVNGNIDNANIASLAAIDGAKLADASVTNAKLSSQATTAWTPAWTNLTVAGSTVTAKYAQIGKLVYFRLVVVLGGGNVPSGAVSFSLPVTSVSYAGTATLQTLGDASYFITNAYRGSTVWASTTTARLVVHNTNSTYNTDNNISATVPANFTNGSEIHASGWYEAA